MDVGYLTSLNRIVYEQFGGKQGKQKLAAQQAEEQLTEALT